MMRCLAAFTLAILALPAPGLADPLDGRDLAAGERLYATHCASCHGADREGQPDWRRPNADGLFPAPPHDETGHTWHHDTALLLDYVTLGGTAALAARGVVGYASGMPAFGEVLDSDEIASVLAYIRSTWPDELQAYQRALGQ